MLQVIKNNYKLISNIVIIISLIFLSIYLYKHNLIVKIKIESILLFVSSFVILILGFIIEAYATYVFLRINKYDIQYKEAFILNGKFILAKYIPGKFGIVVGKASYLNSRYSYKSKDLIQKLIIYHILALFAALFVSYVNLYFILKQYYPLVIIIFPILLLTLIVFSFPRVQESTLRFMASILKLKFGKSINHLSIIYGFSILVLVWLLWCFGFYFLITSLGVSISISTGFFFAFAAVAGIVAIIAPGGIGVREGILVFGLVLYGVSKEIAISVCAFSRIWYLCGEIFMFLLAMLFSYMHRIFKIK